MTRLIIQVCHLFLSIFIFSRNALHGPHVLGMYHNPIQVVLNLSGCDLDLHIRRLHTLFLAVKENTRKLIHPSSFASAHQLISYISPLFLTLFSFFYFFFIFFYFFWGGGFHSTSIVSCVEEVDQQDRHASAASGVYMRTVVRAPPDTVPNRVWI